MLKQISNIFKSRKENLKRNFTKNVTLENLEKMKNKGVLIIDVRSPQEYKEGHIKGAICIPEYEIQDEIEKIEKNKDREIILYCSTGNRSKKARNTLEELGYSKVYNLANGWKNY